MALIDWSKITLTDPPQMPREVLRELKKGIDGTFREFSRGYGEAIENFFHPLLMFLKWFQDLLIETPWPLILVILGALSWWGSRSWKMVVGTVVAFLFIGWLDMWEDTMATLAIVSVATLLCIAIGIPIGILMARSDRVQAMILPVLDIMQTIPSFVYLIPVVMLLGIGKVPGLLAVMIYAIPPIVRLTNLGIRLVDKEVLEAADAFGSSYWQKLFQVQIPLALPNIFAGVNQTIMMALSMVVIAAMIGVPGLGVPVLRAVSNQYLALGVMNGLAIVAIAIIFDRVSQAFGKRLQKHREGEHGA
ncbi:MAG TPA: ABC transporter permease [Rhodobacteraceae bacterium]|jgi:glycine betaine/proline transport system permease protein|nr:proline/glycine betaine ABC transporter permease [Paracoccaceae bacterium]MDE2633680.1 proline/glycine betaine ABC transporter permease [Paracoccaceae bacterium]HBR64118.1 ABC transporter permease [Paracoccaceae bacterium]|tara:strand:+ start:3977 stop:4888 length:912 start_codon:yes stop_codon:yes gene_type:complete